MSATIPEFANTKDALLMLGVNRHTFMYWRRRKFIPAGRKVGIQVLHHMPTLLEAIRVNCLKVSPEARALLFPTAQPVTGAKK